MSHSWLVSAMEGTQPVSAQVCWSLGSTSPLGSWLSVLSLAFADHGSLVSLGSSCWLVLGVGSECASRWVLELVGVLGVIAVDLLVLVSG